MIQVLLVAIGSAIGGVARYLVTQGSLRWIGADFPYGTLIVNVLGSFSIALLSSLAVDRGHWIDQRVSAFVAIGVLGGFTTYSSFNEQTLALFREGRTAAVAINLSATLIGCLIAGTLGFAAGRLFRP
jgi:fluoride exporter